MAIRYNKDGKIIVKRFKLHELETIIHGDNTTGFCRACGHEQDGCEPDTRRYKCEACGNKQVYGAEELLLMGLVD